MPYLFHTAASNAQWDSDKHFRGPSATHNLSLLVPNNSLSVAITIQHVNWCPGFMLYLDIWVANLHVVDIKTLLLLPLKGPPWQSSRWGVKVHHSKYSLSSFNSCTTGFLFFVQISRSKRWLKFYLFNQQGYWNVKRGHLNV